MTGCCRRSPQLFITAGRARLPQDCEQANRLSSARSLRINLFGADKWRSWELGRRLFLSASSLLKTLPGLSGRP